MAVSLLQSPEAVGSLHGKRLAVLADRREPLSRELAKIGRPNDLQRGAFVDVKKRHLVPAQAELGGVGEASN